MNLSIKNKKINIEQLFCLTGIFLLIPIIILLGQLFLLDLFPKNIDYVYDIDHYRNPQEFPAKKKVIFFNFVNPFLVSILTIITFIFVTELNLKRKNHFITLVNFNFLIFYLFKLTFIFSGAGELYKYLYIYSDSITKFIFLINLQYIFLCMVLFKVFENTNFLSYENYIKNFYLEEKKKNNIYKTLIFFIFIYYLISIFVRLYEIDISILNTYTKIFDVDIFILAFCIIYIFNNDKKNYEHVLFSLALISYVLFGLFFLGSKSSLLQILINIFFIFVVINRIYFLNLFTIILTFILSLISIIFFGFGNALRKYLYVELTTHCKGNTELHCYPLERSISNFISYFKDYSLNPDGIFSLKIFFTDFIYGFLNRISYLDFYFSNMSLQNKISESVNLLYYFKSSLDRLTPGFDFFNLPLVKNLLYDIKFGSNFSWVANSTQFTFFAENLIIFGIWLIPYIIFFAFMFKFFLNKVNNFDSYLSISKIIGLIFLIQIFWLWITGFGLDYLIVKSFYLFLIFTFIYFAENYYEKKN